MLGEAVEWSLDAHLRATTVDALNWANYQRAGGKGQKPKPIPRPKPPDEDDED